MIRLIIFNVLLFGSCGYAMSKGTRDAQIVAMVTLFASLATYFFVVSRYAGIEVGVLGIDLLVLIAFAAVELNSDRFWPLWITGLHLTTTFGHVLRAVDDQMVPIAYAVALRFWSYPIQIILIIAVWRSVVRKKRAAPPVSI